MGLAAPQAMRAREGGFSLVEMMVVLVIIGLMASVVVLNLPDPRGRLIDDGEAFAARARAAQQAAIVEARAMALWVSPSGYGFERFRDGAWVPVGEAPFEDRQWPLESTMAVAQRDGERTRIIFDETGLNDPLDISLARGDEAVSVAIGGDGTIRVDG